jgi:hypothetical protein
MKAVSETHMKKLSSEDRKEKTDRAADPTGPEEL